MHCIVLTFNSDQQLAQRMYHLSFMYKVVLGTDAQIKSLNMCIDARGAKNVITKQSVFVIRIYITHSS